MIIHGIFICPFVHLSTLRSHAIFVVTVECGETSAVDGENHIRVGKLNMVDLAGSERQSKTGATGDRFKEATKINLSLSALGGSLRCLMLLLMMMMMMILMMIIMMMMLMTTTMMKRCS